MAMAPKSGVQPSRIRGREKVSWLQSFKTKGIESKSNIATKEGRRGKEVGVVAWTVSDFWKKREPMGVVVLWGCMAGGGVWERPEV